jgi:hypothetical protein
MERFAAFYPAIFIGALLLALVLTGKIILPAAIGAMAMPALLLAGIMLVIVVAARSR